MCQCLRRWREYRHHQSKQCGPCLPTTALTTLTITFAVPYPKTPICIPTEGSSGTTLVDASTTPTTIVLDYAASLTSKVIDIHCEYSANFPN